MCVRNVDCPGTLSTCSVLNAPEGYPSWLCPCCSLFLEVTPTQHISHPPALSSRGVLSGRVGLPWGWCTSLPSPPPPPSAIDFSCHPCHYPSPSFLQAPPGPFSPMNIINNLASPQGLCVCCSLFLEVCPEFLIIFPMSQLMALTAP